MAGPALSERQTEAVINEQGVKIADLLRDPIAAGMIASELRSLQKTLLLKAKEVFQTDQLEAMRINEVAHKLESMCLSLERKYGGWQIGTVASELLGLLAQGALVETGIPSFLISSGVHQEKL